MRVEFLELDCGSRDDLAFFLTDDKSEPRRCAVLARLPPDGRTAGTGATRKLKVCGWMKLEKTKPMP
jgi:hypothetical protein